MKKLITVVALATSVMAPPAFAQSLTPSYGTANVLPFSYGTTTQQTGKVAGRRSGLDAYAMVPGPYSASIDPNSPAATGGGSEGYDQEVLER